MGLRAVRSVAQEENESFIGKNCAASKNVHDRWPHGSIGEKLGGFGKGHVQKSISYKGDSRFESLRAIKACADSNNPSSDMEFFWFSITYQSPKGSISTPEKSLARG